MTNTDSRIVGLAELAPWGDADTLAQDEHQITEDDIRELEAYAFDSDDQTLVGLGPSERASRARKAAALSDRERMPQSEPPGPFIAADDDDAADDEILSSVPGKLSPWAVAVPMLLVAAASLLALARALVPLPTPASKAAVAADAPQALTGSQSSSNVNVPPPIFERGIIRLSAGEGAEDAPVEVIGNSERRELQHLPASIEVEPGEYRIRSTRKGYAPFESTAVLSAANPEVEVNVVLARKTTLGAPSPETALLGPGALDSANASVGSLDITSNPPANVVLDGRPLGQSPRVVQARPGSHTVMFIHPKFGRMSLSVNVNAGRTTAASADF